MEVKDRIVLARKIGKLLGIRFDVVNWPKTITIELHAKKGWNVVFNERKKSFILKEL